MKIALASDEAYRVHDTLAAEIRKRGHDVVPFGAVKSGKDEPWPLVAEAAATSVANGECDEGVLLCWTGTGISMAANKVAGIRAALCFDPGMAKGARIWNHANVLCLSNRLLSDDMAKEILAAWFEQDPGAQGSDAVKIMIDVDQRHRK